jgi:hypothetical protein
LVGFNPVLGNLDIYHFGIVVEDIEAAMRDLGERLELTWAPLQRRRQTVCTGDAQKASEQIAFTYSVQGTPHLELIESEERRFWVPGPAGQLHHLGVFADDVPAESARLAAEGSPLQFGGGDGPKPAGFAYHLLAGGLRLEIVEEGRRAQFAAWMAGGSF